MKAPHARVVLFNEKAPKPKRLGGRCHYTLAVIKCDPWSPNPKGLGDLEIRAHRLAVRLALVEPPVVELT